MTKTKDIKKEILEEKTQTEVWEEEHLRVLSKCSPELLKIVGKHSILWNYSKLETMEKLAEAIKEAREEVVREMVAIVNKNPFSFFPNLNHSDNTICLRELLKYLDKEQRKIMKRLKKNIDLSNQQEDI